VGIWAAGTSVALISGPLTGGGLIALVGWRSIFLVNLPIGPAGLWLSWRCVTETTQRGSASSICRARSQRLFRWAASLAGSSKGAHAVGVMLS
jgi:MFS family permease